MHPDDSANLHILYRETMNRLAIHARRVSEGKDLQAAVEFARFVRFALAPICKANPARGPLPVDGYLLQHTASELENAVTERYRTNNQQPQIHMTELERINHKLELMAGQLARMIPTTATPDTPALTVISDTTEKAA